MSDLHDDEQLGSATHYGVQHPCSIVP